MRALVTGAGGFIGHHLVNRLKQEGYWVRGVDLKEPQYSPTRTDEFLLLDLRWLENCQQATAGIDYIYHLAADMGGIGYISENHATLTRNNALIDCHMLEAAYHAGVRRFLYTSSACVYPAFLQNQEDSSGLRESDAIPADPEKGYGWEKLFAEQLATYYHDDLGLDVRIARFHNIYGPLGTYEGGKEKAPAAVMRKVAEAQDGTEIEVWGDAEQTRSFCYVDDCVEGMLRLVDSGFTNPINLGSEELVTINELVGIVREVAGKEVRVKHDLSRPQGVRGRNSDNSLLREVLGWEPRTTLRQGIAATYPWIWNELAAQQRARPSAGQVPLTVTTSL